MIWAFFGPETKRGIPPPRFCIKRLQVIENKRRDRAKERQEKPRGGNGMRTKDLVDGVRRGAIICRANIAHVII